MDYEEWLETVPEELTGDPLWKMRVYRLALFAADLGWEDITTVCQDKRTIALSDQLYRALGSTSADIAEGYSRGSQGSSPILRIRTGLRQRKPRQVLQGTTCPGPAHNTPSP